jgi:long-chain acyl-CoA synthetase
MMEDRPWLDHYDPYVPATLEYPEIPLHRFLEEAAKAHPDRVCTEFNGGELTYSEMNRLTDELAAALAGLGVRKGQPVGIFMPNIPQFVMAFYAILKAGGVVVATNPLYTPREIEHQLSDAGVELMLVMSSFYNTVKKAQPKTQVKKLIVTNVKEYLPGLLRLLFTIAKEKKEGHRVELEPGDLWLQDVLAEFEGAAKPDREITPGDTALFQYSGGTTGLSKAAVAEHRHLVANTMQINQWLPSGGENDSLLMAIPLFHVYGMVAGMSYAVGSQIPMHMVPNPRDTEDLLGTIDKNKPTIFPGVPALYNLINHHPDVEAGKYDLSSIKACISGSAPLLKETKVRFESLTGGTLVEGYGLSEAPTATHCNPIMGENRTGSIGLPFPDVECRIISLEDEKTVLGPDEQGELVIRSPNVMRGYHNMPTETANSLRDGWLYTGDIATMDEDGYFYILDRKKELIKPSGYQVWPREVEEIIAEHPDVIEVGVAGVPDAYRGETVKAWVVLREGASLTEEELQGFCSQSLAPFKVPTDIDFRDELPKTTVGKILRRVLVEEHMQAVEKGASS